MSDMRLVLSPKFKAFVKYGKAKYEFLEGETAAGKTTVGIVKFIFKVLKSPKKQHAISGLDIGTVEKNIINKDLGIIDIFDEDIVYWPNGHGNEKLAHLQIRDKIIYVFGYNDTTKWKKALGGQLGCLYIDEINIADIDFIREAVMRCDYLMATLNPDDPNLPVYSEYINHARPLKEYEKDVPQEMMTQILSQPPKEGWVHWFFTMNDNAGLTEEKKNQIRASVPVGSKLYKNKILGLRGRSEGLVYTAFDREKMVVNKGEQIFLPGEKVYRVICGLDSGLNVDATAIVPVCLTSAGRAIILPSMYYEPSVGSNASSSQALTIEKWLDWEFTEFGLVGVDTLIVGDSAALTQTVILEINKRTKYKAIPVKEKDIQKDTQRVIAMFEVKDYVKVVNYGKLNPFTFEKQNNTDMLIVELESKIWDKKKQDVPEDGNDHCIDALKYATYLIYYGGGY